MLNGCDAKDRKMGRTNGNYKTSDMKRNSLREQLPESVTRLIDH
jgi:hypothetical protein